MNKELSLVLLSKLSGLTYLDHTSGLVQVFEKTIPIDGDSQFTVKKRIPVTSFATNIECNTSMDQVAMIPDSRYATLLYFEDGGITATVAVRGGIGYESRLRIVCWMNTNMITGNSDMLLSSKAINDILEKLITGPFNSPPFTRIIVSVASIPAQDRSIFSPYDYSESETQYLMPPFEFFAIDLNIKFVIPFACSPGITVAQSNQCL